MRVPLTTIRRWAAQGRIRTWRVGPRNLQVDLNDLDRMREPLPADRWLTEEDRQLARRVAACLLPLADWQKEKLALLLHPGSSRDPGGDHNAAA
jgi:hypothetical protein